MADISKITTPNNTSYDIKDSTARTELLSKASKMELTQAQYDNLSSAEKHNGTMYFITDADPSGGGGDINKFMIADWDFTQSLDDKIHGFTAVLSGDDAYRDSNGVHVKNSSLCNLPIDGGNPVGNHIVVEMKIKSIEAELEIEKQNLGILTYNMQGVNRGLILHRSSGTATTTERKLQVYQNTWSSNPIYEASDMQNSVLKFCIFDKYAKGYLNDNSISNNAVLYLSSSSLGNFAIGTVYQNNAQQQSANMVVEWCKIYWLLEEEV